MKTIVIPCKVDLKVSWKSVSTQPPKLTGKIYAIQHDDFLMDGLYFRPVFPEITLRIARFPGLIESKNASPDVRLDDFDKFQVDQRNPSIAYQNVYLEMSHHGIKDPVMVTLRFETQLGDMEDEVWSMMRQYDEMYRMSVHTAKMFLDKYRE